MHSMSHVPCGARGPDCLILPGSIGNLRVSQTKGWFFRPSGATPRAWLHNKMMLAEIGGQGWVLVGSLNGGEASAKLNRDVPACRSG